MQRDLLSRFSQGIDLYTSAKFRAFHTYLNNSACILHHFPVLTCTYLILNELLGEIKPELAAQLAEKLACKLQPLLILVAHSLII